LYPPDGILRLVDCFPYFVLFQPVKKRKEGEEKRMTQEEMLLEAAETGLPCFFLSTFSHRYSWNLEY
jgi:hypothetical protein